MENLFEKLPEAERKLIEKYIKCYNGYNGYSIGMSASLERILRFWDSNKQDLYTLFENNFIISKEISFKRATDEIEQDMETLVYDDEIGRTFVRAFEKWRENYENYSDGVYHSQLYHLVDCWCLANNKYDGRDYDINLPNGRVYKLRNGCKTIRALGKIAREFNLEGFEEFRLAHSMILNQKELRGELCLSIHPLDYMTMSDNDCEWHSCMSWQRAGEYRQGTVEMMNSPCVVVAYLKASKDMEVPGGYWSNKKWRELFVVTPDIIIGNRQYPYNNDSIRDTALEWLRELAIKVGWDNYTNKPISIDNFKFNEVEGRQIHIDLETEHMYNDFGHGFMGYVNKDIDPWFTLNFSGVSECMCCGDIECEFGDEEGAPCLCCEDCDVWVRCIECGDRHPKNEMTFVDGRWLCSYCYKYHTYVCPICENTHYSYGEVCEREVKIYENENFTGYYLYLCDDCLRTTRFKHLCGEIRLVNQNSWRDIEVVDIENFNIGGLDCIGDLEDKDRERFEKIINNRAS
jgi:hypothetical protein